MHASVALIIWTVGSGLLTGLWRLLEAFFATQHFECIGGLAITL
jgi:hypothetical protein